MAQNINIGGEWLNVPGVALPKAEGGQALFVDPTVTTIESETDVKLGKTYIKADGTTGTGEMLTPSGNTNITANGTWNVSLYETATVNVPAGEASLQSKSVSYTPTETAQSGTVTPDSGYDGLSSVDVSVGAISSTYVGSGIARRSSSNLSTSGASVIVPAGYYSAQATKSVGTATHPKPTVVIDSNGLITANHTQATGYVTGGTTSDTLQLDARTSSDLTVSGTTVTAPAGYYHAAAQKTVTVAQGSATTPATTITATPSISVDPDTGEITVAVSGSQSITPTVSPGYVSSGTAGTVSVSGSGTASQTVLTDADIELDLADSRLLKTNSVYVPPGFVPDSGISASGFPEATFSAADSSFSIGSNGDVVIGFNPTTAGMAYTTSNYTFTKAGAVPTESGYTFTPDENGETLAHGGSYLTGDIIVNPIPAQYIIPSGDVTITQNGTWDVTDFENAIINVASGGGLEYEEGVFEPSESIARPTISFANAHSDPPTFIMMADSEGTAHSATNSNYMFAWFDVQRFTGHGFPYSSSGFRYAVAYYSYRASSTSSISSAATLLSQQTTSTSESGTNYPKYWAKATEFHPYSASTSRTWKAGRSYKWIAIWT